MSSLKKMLSVLDLFSQKKPTFTVDEITESLGLTRPTSYRYIRELSQAGLITGNNGQYRLGVRIIELDYQIRKCDPLLGSGKVVIENLAKNFRGNVLISSVYGYKIVNSHQEQADPELKITLGRGHVLPMGKGATAKIILANMKRSKLEKIYAQDQSSQAILALGKDWKSFLTELRSIREKNVSISHSEIDANNVGIAAPIFSIDGQIGGAVTLVLSEGNFRIYDEVAIITAVQSCAEELQALLNNAL